MGYVATPFISLALDLAHPLSDELPKRGCVRLATALLA
jgi:hypothetical protein